MADDKDCPYCASRPELLTCTPRAMLCVPIRPHVSPQDGGHLVVAPLRHVRSRLALSEEEMAEIDQLSRIAASALSAVLDVSWFNFQENGNWGLDNPEQQHMHLHVYGRSQSAVAQPFGEALRFPARADVGSWSVEHLTHGQVAGLRSEAERLRPPPSQRTSSAD